MNENFTEIDHFYYKVGSNIIPIPYKEKKSNTTWKEYQNNIQKGNEYESLKKKYPKSNWGVITGKLLRGPYEGKYLVCIDLDNKKAMDVFLSFYPDVSNIDEMSKKTIVVQHDDAKNKKAHYYLVTTKPITKRGRIYGTSEDEDNLPIFEIKSDSSTYIIDPGSTHPNNFPYKIIGTKSLMVLNGDQSDQLENKINDIYKKCFPEFYKKNILKRESKLHIGLKKIAKTLIMEEDIPVIKEGTRNLTLFNFALYMLYHHYNLKPEEELKEFFFLVNQKLCDKSLTPYELNLIWNSAIKYVKQNKSRTNKHLLNKKNTRLLDNIIENATDKILEKFNFITIEEGKQIYYYKNGVYVPGGEIIIEREVENLFGYDISNKHIAEVKGHIIRRTYRKENELDKNLNMINLKNGLYDIEKNLLLPHNPNYISINQKPIIYNQKSTSKIFGKFLKEVLYPSEIRTAIEAMAYTFYRDCPFEYFFYYLEMVLMVRQYLQAC